MSLTKQRLIALALTAVTVLAIAACDASASGPDSASEPSPTATFTPAPITGIEIDPQADPAGFLAALPASEVQCASSAVGGSANLELAVSLRDGSIDGVSSTQLGIMAACFSDETVKSVVVGQLGLAAGGLSDETSACIDQNAAGFDLALLFSEGASNVDAAAYVSMAKTLFCLNSEERAAVEASANGFFDFGETLSIDTMECVVDSAGFDAITGVAASFGSGTEGSPDLSAMAGLFPAMVECGVLTDEDVADTGMTVDQMSCVIENTSADTMTSLMAAFDGAATPDFTALATAFTAFEACGLDLEAIMEASAGNSGDGGTPAPGDDEAPVVPVEILTCLTDNGVTIEMALSYAAGMADTTEATLAAAIEVCVGADEGEEGVTVPDGQGGTVTLDPAIFASLPITAEQAQCLVNTIGLEQLEGIANGTVSPVTVLPALTTCEITIADLLGS